MSVDPRLSAEPALAAATTTTATRFADIMLDLSGVRDALGLLGGIAQAATQLVDVADFSSVTISTSSGHYTTPSYTDPDALLLDEVQYVTGRGPCLDATRIPGLGMVSSADLTRGDGPWPELAVVAADHDVRSVLSVGLFPTASPPRLGALNLYARRPHVLTGAAHRAIAVILAAHVGAVLTSTTAVKTR